MKIPFENRIINVPDILIPGAAKSGTTSIAYFLKQHPAIFMPRKEPGFFSYYNVPLDEIPSGIRDRQIIEMQDYSNLYEGVKEDQLICDASVSYFTNHLKTISNIKEVYKEQTEKLKIILILRHPVDRAFSHYLMFLKNGIETLDFKEAIKESNIKSRISQQLGFDYLGNSMYYDRVKSFVEVFPQTKIYFTEDLKNSTALLNDLLDFLGLDKTQKINTSTVLNPSGIPKNKFILQKLHQRSAAKELLKRILPDKLQFKLMEWKASLTAKNIQRVKIDPKLKQELIDQYFKKDIELLQELTGRDLNHWIQSER